MLALVDELARCGIAHACTSPGSRSTPIVLPLVRDGRIRTWSHVDERSAGFFAVGLARATGRAVAIACTSGTAAANLAPAVHEAHEGGVPLIVLTADRPPELREVGAGQVIDQVKLYGSAAKWFFEVGVDDASPARVRWMRSLACRAVWTAEEGRPGVVHLNLPFRDPLVAPRRAAATLERVARPAPAARPGCGASHPSPLPRRPPSTCRRGRSSSRAPGPDGRRRRSPPAARSRCSPTR
jgi:2-succinyl-5-enolpyruvyl-6-hydroxy-3-cyclohexene-1-carboxylate synthase